MESNVGVAIFIKYDINHTEAGGLSPLCLPELGESLREFVLLHRGLRAAPHRLLGGARQVHLQLQPGLVRGLPHEVLHAVLGDVGGGALAHRTLHHAGLDVEVLELLLKLVHQSADLLQVHALHGRAHSLDDSLNKERHDDDAVHSVAEYKPPWTSSPSWW